MINKEFTLRKSEENLTFSACPTLPFVFSILLSLSVWPTNLSAFNEYELACKLLFKSISEDVVLFAPKTLDDWVSFDPKRSIGKTVVVRITFPAANSLQRYELKVLDPKKKLPIDPTSLLDASKTKSNFVREAGIAIVYFKDKTSISTGIITSGDKRSVVLGPEIDKILRENDKEVDRVLTFHTQPPVLYANFPSKADYKTATVLKENLDKSQKGDVPVIGHVIAESWTGQLQFYQYKAFQNLDEFNANPK